MVIDTVITPFFPYLLYQFTVNTFNTILPKSGWEKVSRVSGECNYIPKIDYHYENRFS